MKGIRGIAVAMLATSAVFLTGSTFYQYDVRGVTSFTDTKKNIPEIAVNVLERNTEDLLSDRFTTVVNQPEFHKYEELEEIEIPPSKGPFYLVMKERRQFGIYNKEVIVIYDFEGNEVAVSEVDDVLSIDVK